MTYSSFRYIELKNKDVLLGLILGRPLFLVPFILPFYINSATLSQDKVLTICFAAVVTVSFLGGLLVSARGLNMLLNYYMPKIKGGIKIPLILVLMFIPILELLFIAEEHKKTILIPSLLQPRIGNYPSVLTSALIFLEGVPLKNISSIANCIKTDYFAVANIDEEENITISTRMGLFTALVYDANIYIFHKLEDDQDFEKLKLPEEWKIESSQDNSSCALVCDYNYDPFIESEKSIALEIIYQLKELEGNYNE